MKTHIDDEFPTFTLAIQDSVGQRLCRNSVDDLQSICHGLADEAGWWKDTATGEDVRFWEKKYFNVWVLSKLALVTTEVSEAVEGYRKNKMDDHLPQFAMMTVEIADAIIRLLDLAGGLKLPVGEALVAKLVYNTQRADHKIENRLAEGGKSI